MEVVITYDSEDELTLAHQLEATAMKAGLRILEFKIRPAACLYSQRYVRK